MSPERRFRLGGTPPTIAFVVDWLEDCYQASVLEGAFDAARARGANLLCFAGGVLGAPERGGLQRNQVFDRISAESVAAVIVMSGTLGNYAGPQALAEFCERFRPLPVCSVAADVPGFPSVLVDNDTGMRKAVTHLIRTHGCQRIAFVRGPAMNDEAERRFQVYREVLAEHGLRYDEELVAPGDFKTESGALAVVRLFDEPRSASDAIQAIVAANDAMAVGVLSALGERKIRVPEQVAVVGFDDIEDVRYTTPPLTSVRQPLYEQGKEAVRLVLAELQGRRDEDRVVLHTDLVTRRSCGCFEQGTRTSWAPAASSTRSSFEAAIVERRQIILAELARAARGSFSAAGTGWELRLLNAFTAELRGDVPDGFVRVFDEILHRVQYGGGDVTVCHDVISALRRQLLGCLGAEAPLRARAEDLFQELRLLTGNSIARAQASERLRIERWARTLSDTGAALIGSFDLELLGEAVTRGFPALGISSCAVVLYGEQPNVGRLVFVYRDGKLLEVGSDRGAFPTSELVPAILKARREPPSFVVLPLFFRAERLGYLLLELGRHQVFAYEALRELFSAAVKGAGLVREVIEAREERALTLDALETRQEQLARACERLARLRAAASAGESHAEGLAELQRELDAVLVGLRRLGEPSG